MFLKSIKLTNFRNYSKCDFIFTSAVTVLLGDNAQGKSNFLESIYFLSTTKSPKAEKDEELIKKGEEVARVEGQMESPEQEPSNEGTRVRGPEKDTGHPSLAAGDLSTLEIAMQNIEIGFSKRVKVNGVSRRVLDYIGHLLVVSFSPEDINLVTGPPSLRRWHIDLALASIDRSYKLALTNYGEVVQRKNRLLKMVREGEARVDELDFWIGQQLEFGQIISDKRRAFFEFLNSQEDSFGAFRFEYQESVLTPERLKDYQTREIASAASLIGPHRDDFAFCLLEGENSRNLAHFGSRGEHRTAVLDLKLNEAAFMEAVLGNRPVLLLDDVFSELDSSHKKHVLDLVKLQQTVIAAVDLDEETRKGLKKATICYVANGQISETAER